MCRCLQSEGDFHSILWLAGKWVLFLHLQGIVFRDSGIGIEDDGRSLLEQAESAGLAPQSGCRMGICHTCTRRKLRGAVRNLTTSTVSTADDEDVQICVSVAVGDVDIAL